MASRGKPAEARRPAPRLYLVTPQAADPDGLRDALAGALAAADVAAVLLRLAAADDRTLINRVKALAPVVQDNGAALLLDGHPEHRGARGRRRRASRRHRRIQRRAARRSSPRASPAAAGSHTRHDAMLAAEAGADYVMFGEPDADRPPALVRGDHRAGGVVGGGVRGALRRHLPPRSTRSSRSRQPAPTSSRSAIGPCATRAAAPRRSPRRRQLAVAETVA